MKCQFNFASMIIQFESKSYIFSLLMNPIKKKADKLQPILISKSEASYEKLMLDMMSKLLAETRSNNMFYREQNTQVVRNKESSLSNNKVLSTTGNYFNKNLSSPNAIDLRSPNKVQNNQIIEVEESQSRHNIRPLGSSPSTNKIEHSSEFQHQKQSRLQKIMQNLELRLEASEQINKKLLRKLEQFERQKSVQVPARTAKELNIFEKIVENTSVEGKDSYAILSEILPYSDRRQMKVKFSISDILRQNIKSKKTDLTVETTQWLGMVYRATASICWNMLLNSVLNFEEVKILFTQNIVYNFIHFMSELKQLQKDDLRERLTILINERSVDVLEFLCKQYPQTKIEAPNMALRSILPQIDNQGRVKYQLVSKSGISLVYSPDRDYTPQIMRMVNFIIDKSNEQFDQFNKLLRKIFEEVNYPIHKRRSAEQIIRDKDDRQLNHEDIIYKEKVKSYTKYLIGRKVSKDTAKYTEQQIEDGVFFVKSSAVLRIITKWVEQLMEYVQKPEEKIKDSYSQSKDHFGKPMYISALLKNGISKAILKKRGQLMNRLEQIKQQCYKIEYLLTEEEFISDKTQVHLSVEQISVGMYCSGLKSVISSYICSQLNEIIHFLLSIPLDIDAETLDNELLSTQKVEFITQAKKDLESVNLITFKIFDILRCKIHSNEQQIIWVIEHFKQQNKLNKQKFGIVRIKDRLNLGTRDIMVNAQINKGLVCQIQISVTSNTDKKQELLDQYNHFLYELKRSNLGPITENVSIWSTLQQRFSYFQQLMKEKAKKQRNVVVKSIHKCGNQKFKIFKRPIMCKNCNNFYAIPKTCLLNVVCQTCQESICGQCYYYNFLGASQRKLFVMDDHRLMKADVLQKLKEYTDFQKVPLPPTGFFIKKKFLKKQLSFYMAIEKNKVQNVKDNPSIEVLIVQTIVRNDQVLNRQLNKKEIQARLEKGQFFIKKYEKSQLSNYIIFYFDKEFKKLMTLTEIQTELLKPENRKIKILNIVRQPSYIADLHLLSKDSQKTRELANLQKIVNNDKIVVYRFKTMYILAQDCVKGSVLRAQITKKINISALKQFANKQTDVVTLEHKKMTTELDQLPSKMKTSIYEMFCKNLRKLFLANGDITSITCFANFINLEMIVISENKITSLQGIQKLQFLVSIRFDHNRISSLQPFAQLSEMRYISGNKNEITNLKGFSNLPKLKILSLTQNKIQNIDQIKNHQVLQQLYLRKNPINDLSVVSTLKELRNLFIGQTKITQIPKLSNLPQLVCLSLQNLNLTDIPNIFQGLKLTELYLGSNSIKKIQNLQPLSSTLMLLNLSNNSIEEIVNLSCLEKLEYLKLQSNTIKNVEGVKNLDSLKSLNLKNNPIDDINELSKYQITFKYQFTTELLTENARKQLLELSLAKENVSSGQD